MRDPSWVPCLYGHALASTGILCGVCFDELRRDQFILIFFVVVGMQPCVPPVFRSVGVSSVGVGVCRFLQASALLVSVLLLLLLCLVVLLLGGADRRLPPLEAADVHLVQYR